MRFSFHVRLKICLQKDFLQLQVFSECLTSRHRNRRNYGEALEDRFKSNLQQLSEILGDDFTFGCKEFLFKGTCVVPSTLTEAESSWKPEKFMIDWSETLESVKSRDLEEWEVTSD